MRKRTKALVIAITTLLVAPFMYPYNLYLNPVLMTYPDVVQIFLQVNQKEDLLGAKLLREKDQIIVEKQNVILNLNETIRELTERLELTVIIVNGSVTTNFGTSPTAIVFESGGLVSRADVNVNKFETLLQNFRHYAVTIEYTGIIPGSCTVSLSFDLNTVTNIHSRDFSC